ncbi:hypothetical protein [Pararhizobium arenae]|nr:hypothetical protein [Pararhizobium arenae]
MIASNLPSFAAAIANESLPGKIEFDKYPPNAGPVLANLNPPAEL